MFDNAPLHAFARGAVQRHSDARRDISVPPRRIETHEPAGPMPQIRSRLAGEFVYSEGDTADRLFELLEGSVILAQSLADERRQIVDLVEPGRIFGFGGTPTHDLAARAVTRVRYLAWPISLLRADATMMARVPAEMNDALARQYARTVSLGRRTAVERIAGFLLERAAAAGINADSGPESFSIVLSRTDIADYLGLVLETVSRILARLQTDGLVRFDGMRRMTITDWQRLADHAGQMPNR